MAYLNIFIDNINISNIVNSSNAALQIIVLTLNYIDLNKEQSEKILEILNALEELDDVQNIFTNANLENIKI